MAETFDLSFFVTSMAAILELSGSDQGFGGDLSYDGQSGVLGADAICSAIAERALPGSKAKAWKAFGAPVPGDTSVGAGCGYGGFYCFASKR